MIDKLKKPTFDFPLDHYDIVEKINEIIDVVNKIDKRIEEK